MILIVLLLFIIPDECIIHSFNSLFLNWNYRIHIFIIYFYPTFIICWKTLFCNLPLSKQRTERKAEKKAESFTPSNTSVILKTQQSQRVMFREGRGKGIVLEMFMHLIVKTIHVWAKESGDSFALPKSIACEVSKK